METQERLNYYQGECEQCRRELVIPLSCKTCPIPEERGKLERKREWEKRVGI